MKRRIVFFVAIVSFLALVAPQETVAYTFELPLSGETVVTKPQRTDVERGFVAASLPDFLDTVFIDVAELVLTVSTVSDTSEPLLIAAFESTVEPSSRSSLWSRDWDKTTGGFNMNYGDLVAASETKESAEIRLNVTTLVRRWQAGETSNHGFVLKSLSEDKSTYSWIRDGRYAGGNAKLVIKYSPLD